MPYNYHRRHMLAYALGLFEKEKKMGTHALRGSTLYKYIAYIHIIIVLLSFEVRAIVNRYTGPVKCFCQTFVYVRSRPETIINTQRWEKKVTSYYSKRVTMTPYNSSHE